MKKSILLISLTFAVTACSSDAADKDTKGKGWTLGNNSTSNNGQSNNGTLNNGQSNNGINNGFTTGVTNNLTSNNGTTPSNNATTSPNNGTTGSSNNNTTNGGTVTTGAECNLNSECQNGLFCCPQGFQGGPGTCESSCQMNGGKCGGDHAECNEPLEGCCEQIDICSERCSQNPAGTVCATNPDCSNGQVCCPNFGGGDSTCADDCGSDRIGGVCETAADCSGQTAMCCDLPIGTNKLCLQQCGI